MDDRAAYRQRIETFVASRDAGSSVTLDALQVGVAVATLDDAAVGVAEFVDAAQEIVSEQYRPVLACQPGCAYCCRKPGVLVTTPEFVRVLVHVDGSFDAASRAALAERANDYVVRLGGRAFDALTDDSVPCPLLVDERCSVYDHRPLVCRGYNSTDADACRRAHDDGRVGVPIFAPLKDVTDATSVGITDALKRCGADAAMLDLGTALHQVLSHAVSADQLIDRPGVLAAARNTTWSADLTAAVSGAARTVGIRLSAS